jgi:uncharacterized protein YcaQ
MIEISLPKAQRFILQKQGILTQHPAQSVLEVAKRIHNIQLDTISVVARSHDLTVFTRFPKYEEKAIWELQKHKQLFESISHALCLLPISTYPFYNCLMTIYRHSPKNSYWSKWIQSNQHVIDQVYNAIKQQGALSSKDFKVPLERKSKGWWAWKSEKRALEYLFHTGQLLIQYRKGFQKFYDLPERVLPPGIDHEPMPIDEIPEYLCDQTFASFGIGNHQEMRFYLNSRAARHLWDNKPERITRFLDEQVKKNLLTQVKIDTLKEPQYIRTQDIDLLLNDDSIPTKRVHLINPFDNIIRERALLAKYWQFNYTLEAYTPPAKRKYGYYLMPILDGHQFIGRLEPKVHRKEQLLEIKSIFFKPGYRSTHQSLERLYNGIQAFAEFHKCDQIQIGKVSPASYQTQIETLFH